MSAVLTRRRNARGRSRDRDRDPGVQASLFGQVAAPPPVAPEPERSAPEPERAMPRRAAAPAAPAAPAGGVAPSAPESRVTAPEPNVTAPEPSVVAPGARASRPLAGPTLDDAMSSLWRDLLRAESAACPVCGEPMQPRHSAGAGVVGGRCGGCGSTVA
jgi:hypothetical protein